MVEQPLHTRGGEVGVYQETALVHDHLDSLFVSAKLATQFCTTGVLPDDSTTDGLACLLVPYDSRLALVGDAEAVFGRRKVCRTRNKLADGLYHVVIDFFSVVFHPTCLGIVLLVVDIGATYHATLFVKQ